VQLRQFPAPGDTWLYLTLLAAGEELGSWFKEGQIPQALLDLARDIHASVKSVESFVCRADLIKLVDALHGVMQLSASLEAEDEPESDYKRDGLSATGVNIVPRAGLPGGLTAVPNAEKGVHRGKQPAQPVRTVDPKERAPFTPTSNMEAALTEAELRNETAEVTGTSLRYSKEAVSALFSTEGIVIPPGFFETYFTPPDYAVGRVDGIIFARHPLGFVPDIFESISPTVLRDKR